MCSCWQQQPQILLTFRVPVVVRWTSHCDQRVSEPPLHTWVLLQTTSMQPFYGYLQQLNGPKLTSSQTALLNVATSPLLKWPSQSPDCSPTDFSMYETNTGRWKHSWRTLYTAHAAKQPSQQFWSHWHISGRDVFPLFGPSVYWKCKIMWLRGWIWCLKEVRNTEEVANLQANTKV